MKDQHELCIEKAEQKGYSFKGRIWIEVEGATFLGYGRVTLLERIREYGSISQAARSMEMSYRHAWDLVDSMNRQSPKPLVETTTGGRGGGGAKVTETGEQAITHFWNLYKRFKKFLDREAKKFSL